MKTDVAIVGGGPGGTAHALFLAQRGISSVIIEKDGFPRYHIGESLTGECGNCLRDLGLAEDMHRAQHPVKWGVTVYGPEGKNSFWIPVMGRCPEKGLVEASTWQVRRSDFDAMLMNKATEAGATLVQGTASAALRDNGSVRGVQVEMADGGTQDIEAQVVADASGMATFLCNAGVTSEKGRGTYDKQVAIFAQLSGAIRDEGKMQDNTLIFYRLKNHWAWFIPLDGEIVSVGVVVPSSYFLSRKESKHDFLVRELGELNPELKRRLPEFKLTDEVRAISNYSYEIKRYTGKGWLCIGDAHRFIDPVFSFGLYFSMKEAQQAAAHVDAYLGGANRDAENPFAEFQRNSERGMNVIQDALDAFWDHPLAFAFFAHTRYVNDFIDLFAGRVYADSPSRGVQAIQAINEQGRMKAQAAAMS